MQANEYQSEAKRTDNVPWKEPHGSEVAILGVIGELGSLASVIKKHQRDKNVYASYREDFFEELGDILWYITTIATRLNIELSKWQSIDKISPDIHTAFYKLHEAIIQLSSSKDALIKGEANSSVSSHINVALICLQDLAHHIGSNLSEIARENANKTLSYWSKFQDIPARQRDKKFPFYEKLPRQFSVDFQSINEGKSIIMIMKELAIGDRLTDNSHDDDGYRFHDVFHIAGAAMLGWSPVFRRILKLKRKSDSRIDEVEDGARAAIVEEAVINHIFDYAREFNFLEGMKRVDLDLIKRVKKLVRGYEVADCEPWEWNMCILKSYEIFRQLKKNGGGRLIVDAEKRSIVFEVLEPK
jgi:NTP pyrophosphatase (non-canonical NTP hydrolase)